MPTGPQDSEQKSERLFGTESGYQQLDERKRLTSAKIAELLLVARPS